MVVGRDLANLLCMNNLSNHLATYYNVFYCDSSRTSLKRTHWDKSFLSEVSATQGVQRSCAYLIRMAVLAVETILLARIYLYRSRQQKQNSLFHSPLRA